MHFVQHFYNEKIPPLLIQPLLFESNVLHLPDLETGGSKRKTNLMNRVGHSYSTIYVKFPIAQTSLWADISP